MLKSRILRAAFFLILPGTLARAQTTPPDPAQQPATVAPDLDKPLPDIPSLMREVEVRERAAEAIEKDYIYREDSTFDEVDSHGQIKKNEERAFDIFWIDGVRLARLVRKDGKDLSPDELTKENDRIDKEVAKAKQRRAKADTEGKDTDSDGRNVITASRILELGSFSNPRRILVAGRPTIQVDYNGDPKAKSHNPGEAAIKLLTGIVCIDEHDKLLQHAEGHFTGNFKVGGGLVADIRQGTSFSVTYTRINNEVWLPSTFDAQGHLRYLLFFSLNGDAHMRASDYRKFKASATILPGMTEVPPDTAPPGANPNPPPNP
jgi:hypothetical protein